MKISVIIVSRNRPEKLSDCLNSILENFYQNFEIIVVDQSDDDESGKIIKNINNKKIRHLRMNCRGKSKGLNFGLKQAKGEIIAFTDDDCIVTKNWLEEISFSFEKDKEISGLTGKILPYQPQKHRGLRCPSTFNKKKCKLIKRIQHHSKNIGSGNNMAFKKDIFEKLGGFKEWLGPNSIGLASEDAEFFLRVLINKFKLLYDNNLIVFHDRWLTKKEFNRQFFDYMCGEIACYGYFAFQKSRLSRQVVVGHFKDSWYKFKILIKSLLGLRKRSFTIIFFFQVLAWRIWGLAVAFYFSKKEPIGKI